MSLRTRFTTEIQPTLATKLGITNPMLIPKLKKISLNIGLGEALKDKKVIDAAVAQLGVIAGQKPVVVAAHRSISTFKLRAGQPIGVKVTLRGARMYDFFEKLVTVVLTKVRDFRGVSRTSFDGQGNYTLGFTEQIIFPEIEYSKIDKIRGLEVTFVTSASTDEHAFELLTMLGMPFTKEEHK